MPNIQNQISAILFDLDGTLIDSIPDISAALNIMRTQYNLKPVEKDIVRNIVGKGFPTTVRKVLALDLPNNEVENIFPDAYRHTLNAYSDCMGKHTTIFPGVAETLSTLQNKKIKMAIVTNKEEKHAKETLIHTGLAKYVEIIVGGNTTPHYKPNPEPLNYAIDKVNADPSATFMVGDSESDIKAAKAANVKSIAVTYGYNHGKPISESEPDIIINNINELLSLVD